jgi:two-component system cell cycle sensor histidine kinase/response regulator CckA
MRGLSSIVESIKSRVHRSLPDEQQQRQRVLVVDDEEEMRQYLDTVLTDAGYITTIAVDGTDALGKFESNGPFDLLLTDLMMPQMSGDELARRVRRIEPSMKVLYVTGFSDQLFTSKPTLWDEEAYLEKPCSPAHLVEAVSLLVDGRIRRKTVWG